jgi:hypothetical protein
LNTVLELEQIQSSHQLRLYWLGIIFCAELSECKLVQRVLRSTRLGFTGIAVLNTGMLGFDRTLLIEHGEMNEGQGITWRILNDQIHFRLSIHRLSYSAARHIITLVVSGAFIPHD